MRFEIDKQLGATHPVGTSQIVLFIPSSDRDGASINQPLWRDEALKTLGTLFRGATAFPPGQGVWRNDEADGALLFEQTVIIISYANPDDLTEEALETLREFLHRFGSDANQGEVGIVIDGRYYGISHYDPLRKDLI